MAESLCLEAETSTLVYLPNPGNWGAALTAEATRRFLATHAIGYRELRRLGPLELTRGLVRRETLLLGGGGAWSERYPGGQQLAARAARWFRRIIVLPSSFGTSVRLPTARLWARDRFGSLERVPAARFCHDIGFSLGRLDARPPSAGIGEFFRGDRLSRAPRSDAAVDLSSRGDEHSPLQPFLDEIARYEAVHTDRVHVAIVACLMGRRCHVWPTATPLLADLFASSIAPHFPAAIFRGELPPIPAQNS
ncbi:MAG: hypothetical protein ACO4CP_08910 [Steroidobacteraceae bacterium]